VSQVLGGAAPAGQHPAGQNPAGQHPVSQLQPAPVLQAGTPGVTGHAPMVADGYYAAAAYGTAA